MSEESKGEGCDRIDYIIYEEQQLSESGRPGRDARLRRRSSLAHVIVPIITRDDSFSHASFLEQSG
jgi:hypothetical protein